MNNIVGWFEIANLQLARLARRENTSSFFMVMLVFLEINIIIIVFHIMQDNSQSDQIILDPYSDYAIPTFYSFKGKFIMNSCLLLLFHYKCNPYVKLSTKIK